MRLAVVGRSELVLLMSAVLPVNFSVDLGLIMISKPFSFLLHRLLQQNVLFTVLIDVLQEVDTGLVLAAPLLLTSVPLLLVLLLSEVVNHALIGLLVTLLVLIVGLEFLDLPTPRHALIILVLLDGGLAVKRLVEEHLITGSVFGGGGLSQLLLSGVVSDQFKISLTVEKEPLIGILLLLLLFNLPLSTKHGLLIPDEVFLLLALDLASVLLPVEDGHGVPDLLLLLTGFLHLTLQFLLCVKLPELSIDLLFEHLLLNITPLVNELLLAFDGCAIVVELGVFLAEGIVLGLELHVLAASHLISSLLLTLVFESLEALEHLLTDLLRSFEVVVKFLFIDAVFGGQQLGETDLALLKIGGLLAAHLYNTALYDVCLLHLGSFGLPVGFVSQVAITLDVINHSLLSLYIYQSLSVC